MLEHDIIIRNCDTKRDRLGLKGLSEAERVVALVSWADFEIENGGLSQFYYNHAGDDAPEVVSALRQIGALKTASALEQANALLSEGGPYPRDRQQRYEKLQSIKEMLVSLTEAVYGEDPDAFAMLCDYIDAHEQELRDSGVIR